MESLAYGSTVLLGIPIVPAAAAVTILVAALLLSRLGSRFGIALILACYSAIALSLFFPYEDALKNIAGETLAPYMQPLSFLLFVICSYITTLRFVRPRGFERGMRSWFSSVLIALSLALLFGFSFYHIAPLPYLTAHLAFFEPVFAGEELTFFALFIPQALLLLFLEA